MYIFGRFTPGFQDRFLFFLLLAALVYLVWRISDLLPDVVFRLGEIQRDIAELRRQQDRGGPATVSATPVGTGANLPTAGSPPPAPAPQ